MFGEICSRKTYVLQQHTEDVAMSVAISRAKKVQLVECDILIGFPKSSHILWDCFFVNAYIVQQKRSPWLCYIEPTSAIGTICCPVAYIP